MIRLDQILRFRWVILVCFLLLFVSSVFGLSKLGLNPNNRVFFGPGDPQFSELVAFESEFGTNTSLLFGITSTESVEHDEQLVLAVHWLTEQAWSIRNVSRVDSLTTYPHGVFSENEITLTTLADAYCVDVCGDIASGGLLAPHIVNRYISPDGRTLSVIASVELDTEDSAAVLEINTEARLLVEEFGNRFPSLELNLTGAVPMMQAFMDASNHDLSSLIVVAVLLFIVLLFVFLRGVYLTFVLVMLGVSSILITLGMAGWAGHIVNTATATTPLVIFTLVVAGSMHVFLYIVRDPCYSSVEVGKAIDKAYSANTTPVLLAAATSVVGLLSLVFVSAPPIKQLGVLAALGVVVGTVLLLTVVPCALSMMNSIRPSRTLALVQRWLNGRARKIEARTEKPGIFVVGFCLCLVWLPLMNVDEDFVRYFGSENSFRHDSEAMTARLAGPYHAEVVLDTSNPGGIYTPEVISIVESLQSFLRADDSVVNVLSVNDVLREVSSALVNTKSLDSLSSDALAQFFLSFELALAKGQSTTDFVDVDHRMVRLSVLFGDISMADIRQFERRVGSWAIKNVPNEYRVTITGEGIPTAHLSSNSIRQLSVGIAISLLFSSCLLGLIYRSVRVTAVVLLATTVPVLAGFGIWAIAVGEIGMAATLVVAVTIGVVIDDSIHLLYRFRNGLTELDLSPIEAAGYSVHRTGAAIVTTSVVLAGGFSVLMLSEFRMNSTFGVCSALVIILALVYNTTLMPRSLVWVEKTAKL